MKQLTKQQTFDKVAHHLLEQGEQSRDGHYSCVYREESGLKCAVGCLITDEAYSSDLEDCSVDEENVKAALKKSGIGMSNIIWLETAQKIHDRCEPEEWKRKLEVLAEAINVKWTYARSKK